jgi:crotonobetainyl-CoA:carnitine CoA-transferase CaiB-like acyl-CoA transferase
MTETHAGILSGIRVLDFGRYVAGPYCATLLAEFGAEVIRIEKLAGSEDRYVTPLDAPDGPAGGVGAMFLQMNRNKRGMTLNPMKSEGRAVMARLIASADVVVANLPAPGLAAMGLDHASLRAIKPDIILATMSTFGTGGPYSDRVGFDGLGQTMSGAAHLSGENGVPAKSIAVFVDFGTAMMSAFGVLLALRHRDRTGEGQVVEGALLRTAITMMNSYIIEQAIIAPDRVGTGARSQIAGPSDYVRAANGWFMTQVVGDPLFARWARMIGRPEMIEDPRFSTDAARGRNGAALSALANAHAGALTLDEAVAAYAAAGVPAGPVLTPQQVLDDPHVAAMGFLTRLAHPGLAAPAPLASAPISLSATPGAVRTPAPALGADTDAILGDLGYDGAALADLRAKRVI